MIIVFISKAIASCLTGPDPGPGIWVYSPSILSQTCMKNPISPGQLLSAHHQTWSPIGSNTIHVPTGYESGQGALAFSSIHAQEMFDCRKSKFSKIKPKPQSIIRKAHEVFNPGRWNLPNCELWLESTYSNQVLLPCLEAEGTWDCGAGELRPPSVSRLIFL